MCLRVGLRCAGRTKTGKDQNRKGESLRGWRHEKRGHRNFVLLENEAEKETIMLINCHYPAMKVVNVIPQACAGAFFSLIPSCFQTSVLDLKEKASSLASTSVKRDNRLKCLEIGLEQKREECVQLENQLKKVTVNYCY